MSRTLSGQPPVTGTRRAERQVKVLECLSYGMTNAEIAVMVGLTEDTVKGLMRELYRAVGARDRCHAVRRGFELGLLTPDGVD